MQKNMIDVRFLRVYSSKNGKAWHNECNDPPNAIHALEWVISGLFLTGCLVVVVAMALN